MPIIISKNGKDAKRVERENWEEDVQCLDLTPISSIIYEITS